MRQLILVKHSTPLIDPAKPSHEWPLSDEGKQRCEPLAEAIRPFEPRAVVSSTEPKALQTAQILAEKLGLTAEEANDLYEHDRSNVPHMNGAEFQSAVAQFFNEPDDLVLGEESANEAQDRMLGAVEDAVAKHSEGNLVIVSHGTVITLLVAHYNKVRPYQLWRQLRLPSFVVLELPEYKLVQTVDKV